MLRDGAEMVLIFGRAAPVRLPRNAATDNRNFGSVFPAQPHGGDFEGAGAVADPDGAVLHGHLQ